MTYRFFEGLDTLLTRELNQSRKVLQPDDIEDKIEQCFFIHNEDDIIDFSQIKENIYEIDYIALGTHPSGIKYSPNYQPGGFEIGHFRDTQLTFVLNFETGLFGWLYLNVQPELRSQGIGTKLVKAVEKFAYNIGFHRFSVEWPNLEYWMKYLQYHLDMNLRFEQENYGYTIEMYKEIA